MGFETEDAAVWFHYATDYGVRAFDIPAVIG